MICWTRPISISLRYRARAPFERDDAARCCQISNNLGCSPERRRASASTSWNIGKVQLLNAARENSGQAISRGVHGWEH